MMITNKVFYIIGACILFTACTRSSQQKKQELYSSSTNIELNEIRFSFLESDLDNETNEVELPKLYFQFLAENDSKKEWIIDFKYEQENNRCAYLVIRNNEKADTLSLTEFNNPNHVIVQPESKKGFSLTGYLPDLPSEYQTMKLNQLIGLIIDEGKIYITNCDSEKANFQYYQVTKNDKMKLSFSNPNDGSIE